LYTLKTFGVAIATRTGYVNCNIFNNVLSTVAIATLVEIPVLTIKFKVEHKQIISARLKMRIICKRYKLVTPYTVSLLYIFYHCNKKMGEM
jgi:hypothetical protein